MTDLQAAAERDALAAENERLKEQVMSLTLKIAMLNTKEIRKREQEGERIPTGLMEMRLD